MRSFALAVNIRPLAVATALLMVTSTLAPTASADTVPNLVAVGSPDYLMAVTFGAYTSPRTMADAGAFSTTMINQWGMVALPNYDPTSERGSWLVCSIPVSLYPEESVGVYAIIRSAGVDEAVYICQSMADQGYTVNWAPAP
jgi:hypothetical protein